MEAITQQEMERVEKRADEIKEIYACCGKIMAKALSALYLGKYNNFKVNFTNVIKPKHQAIQKYFQSKNLNDILIGQKLFMDIVDRTDKIEVASMYYCLYMAYNSIGDE